MKTFLQPTAYEYALLSNCVYKEDPEIKKQKEELTKLGWKELKTYSGPGDYLGILYANEQSKQLVLSHRGTATSIGWLQDFLGIFNNFDVAQKHQAFQAVASALGVLKQKPEFSLSFTGHSLGGYLAELSVYFCHKVPELLCPEVSAVTFESPGAKTTATGLQGQHAPLDLSKLNVTGYVSYPNFINTCNAHIGSLYTIESDLTPSLWPTWYSRQTHSMTAMVQWFEKKQAARYITDWPVGKQYQEFFNHHELVNHHYQEKQVKDFIEQQERAYKLSFSSHYGVDKTGLNNKNSMPLHHFPPQVIKFLIHFHDILLNDLEKKNKIESFVQALKEKQIAPEIIACLTNFRLFKLISTDLFMVRLNDNIFAQGENAADIADFCNLLSQWLLQDNQLNTFTELLKASGMLVSDTRLQISATAVNEGVTIDPGAVFVAGDVIASIVHIQKISGDDPAKEINKIMQQWDNKVASVTASALPKEFRLKKGVTIKVGNVIAAANYIGEINTNQATNNLILNQASFAGGRSSASALSSGYMEEVRIGKSITYTQEKDLYQIKLSIADIPSDKRDTIQKLMDDYAENCEKADQITKNHAQTKTTALRLPKDEAENLIEKLCGELMLPIPPNFRELPTIKKT